MYLRSIMERHYQNSIQYYQLSRTLLHSHHLVERDNYPEVLRRLALAVPFIRVNIISECISTFQLIWTMRVIHRRKILQMRPETICNLICFYICSAAAYLL